MTPDQLNFELPDPKKTRIEIALSEPRTTIRIIDAELLMEILSNKTVSAPDILLRTYDDLHEVHALERWFQNQIERILIRQEYAKEYIEEFLGMLALRLAVVERVAHIKAQYKGTPPKDKTQWIKVLESICSLAIDKDLDQSFITDLWNTIHTEAVRIEGEIIQGYAIEEEYSTQS